ncbi:MAG: zinc-ribbon domain-containing protein [Eggerthellaceae bacterium]
MLAGYNDLATTHPGIAAMWHPRMNKRLKPTGVQAVSRKLAWWRGECGHLPDVRPRQGGAKPGYCPYCSGKRREADAARQPSAPRRGRNGGVGASCYRRDFANIGLGGYAWLLRSVSSVRWRMRSATIGLDDELPEAIEGELRSFDSERKVRDARLRRPWY